MEKVPLFCGTYWGKELEVQDESQSSDDTFLTLIKAYKPLLIHIIELDVHNPVDVDDIFQEIVLAILEHFRKGRVVEHPKAWMVKIAKSKCIDFYRQEEREANKDIDLAPLINPAAFGGGVSIADEQHQAVVVQEILDVIARMKPIYRNVGKLHIHGYTTPEISELLGIPEGTVTSRLRKFRQLIREYLEMDAPLPEREET